MTTWTWKKQISQRIIDYHETYGEAVTICVNNEQLWKKPLPIVQYQGNDHEIKKIIRSKKN